MIFLLSTFLLLFSQFHCVFSADVHIENAKLFNEFIKLLLGFNPEHSKHEITVANAAKFLELVEKNVAKEILTAQIFAHNSPNEVNLEK